jgi:hypothetical protein
MPGFNRSWFMTKAMSGGGLHIQLILDAIYESAVTGKGVEIG